MSDQGYFQRDLERPARSLLTDLTSTTFYVNGDAGGESSGG
jgi:hypothetical protein